MEAEGKTQPALSEARRALLQRYLRGGAAPAEAKPQAIPRRDASGPAPLSYSQQQIWLHSQLAGESLIYNEPITIHRRGPLDHEALERAFTEIIRRHEAWRTTFHHEGERVVQIVEPAPDRVAIPALDLSAHPAGEKEALRLATKDAHHPFNLARGPMYRLRLVSLDKDEHRLFLTLHHIIFDGVSLYRVLLPELIALYQGFARGESPSLPALPIQYPDFATWQRETITNIRPEHFSFWQNVCADLPVLDLPTDRPRPPVQTYAGAIEVFDIPAATTAALKSLSQAEGATPFITMVAAFMTLLHSYTGDEDLVIGGISGGRSRSETLGLLGCFLNTVPIRCAFEKERPFADLLSRVRTATLGALSHDEVPFEMLVQKFAQQRDPSRAPLIQSLIVFEPPLEKLPDGWGFTHMDVETGTAKFDLQLGLDDRAEGLSGRFIYNFDLFDAPTIRQMRQRWLQLLESIAADPKRSVADLTAEICSTEMAPLPPAEWNQTRTDYPREASINSLFEEQAKRTPTAIAVVFGNTETSYQELNQRANRLARRLQKLGVGRDRPVGLYLERSLEMLVALLAVLKAGGAYLPLDPAYPAERIEWMINDTDTPIILMQTRLRDSLQTRASVLCVGGEDFSAESDENLALSVAAEGLACIIYTSGSTGRPKGVAVPHRAVVRLVCETSYASFGAAETFLQLAPISFDASTFEIWGALLHGSRLVVMPPAAPSLEEIGAAISRHGVTTLWLTSALFNAMVDERLEDLRPLRQLLAGGDVLSPAHVGKVLRELPHLRLINGYGPTESTTFACCHTIPRDMPLQSAIPIGKPISNTTAHILDQNLQLVPVGTSGQLHLGGDGLARGYWRREKLTSEKFIPDPFSQEPGARLYKTGDLARWRDDGLIEFLGRADKQIKFRGFRIEPGEIESALKAQPGVKDCAVIAREDLPNDKRLVAYVVGLAEASALLPALRKSLPDYMVPSAFVSLPVLPRTANGKLDRRALPAPQASGAFVAPRTPLETQIAAAWGKVLGLERVGANDNFFELGGHSLVGLRLANQLREILHREIPLRVIFEAPTVSSMARLLESAAPAETKPVLPAIVPINRESRRARRG